jgi:dihydroneopterin aldolase
VDGEREEPEDGHEGDEFAAEDELDATDEDLEAEVTVGVTGLSVYTHHGISEAERQVGQRLVFDVSFEVGPADATLTDRVEDTVDYSDAAQQILLVAQERSYRTLERLCAVVADRLLDRYELEAVSVRAAKPEPPMPLSVEEVSVEVRRERG